MKFLLSAEVGFQAMALLDAFRIKTFLLFSTRFFYLTIGQEVFSIIREPKDSNSRAQWTHLDYFIPSTLECSRSGATTVCSAYNGYYVISDCQCQCTYQKSTFGFYSGSWTCLNNDELRNRTGCKYKFEFEYDNYPLKMVEANKTYNVILPSKGCLVESRSTRYLTCDGRWADIDSQSWFTISRLTKNTHKYELKIESDDDLVGRIIKLHIDCGNRGRSCLLFKLRGTLQCPENITSVTNAKPLPTTKELAPDQIPTAAKATATASASATATATVIASDDGNKGKVKAVNDSLSSTVGGIIIALVIIVVMVIMIVGYVYCKRRSGESVWLSDHIFSRARKTRSTQQKRKTVDKIPEEPEYAEIPEEQRRNEPVDQAGGIYSYVLDDPHTAYTAPQPAPYDRLVHNRQGAVEEGTIYSTADDGPVYNVLERPPEGNNITLATENTQDQGPPFQTHEPEYYILEGPDTDVK